MEALENETSKRAKLGGERKSLREKGNEDKSTKDTQMVLVLAAELCS